ncbi:hypothetical protein JTY93_17695 [Pseudomonas hygromyciniae]|uniref:Uncharacterized protein n=1 Tax=Pseudomonas hygromyciniae TaxID=2812000 RepID=A0ABX7JTJ0_9PSED|nr:hypothetical protein [Pseudomonas hygromyciniae]MBN0977909.1 hypothetical protein [Pseudomonas hygromyciniae]QSB38108.1 hypothetical protein JTY93_17695 [Pseudomonas hygromyciniae]
MNSVQMYHNLMQRIRARFDVIDLLRISEGEYFTRAESAAFQGRKIVEGIAYACLIAIEHGAQQIPRDAKKQWNAEKIFKNLKSKGFDTLPSPSEIRSATEQERADGLAIVVEGIPVNRLSHDQIAEVYQRLHAWLHEANPYIYGGSEAFGAEKTAILWKDLDDLKTFLKRHIISVQGEAIFCTLWDLNDDQTKILPLSKLKL